MLKIIFLGTGTSQGIPVIGSKHPVCLSKDTKDIRLRSSICISWEKYSYIIDCTPDFRTQMLTNNIHKIEGIIFTHEHADHTAGLDDIRPYSNRDGVLPIYGNRDVINSLKKRFFYAFDQANKYPGAPQMKTIIIDETPFYLGDKQIIPIEVWHGTLKIFGYRIDNFAYITDAKRIEEKEIEKLKNLDVLVVNTLRFEPHVSHFNLEEMLIFVDKIKPKKVYLTHISHLLGFHKDIAKHLPHHIEPAYDTLSITIE